MKIISFNTQHCRSFVDNRIDFELMASVIKSLDADVVGLQEMRGEGSDHEYTAQVEKLSELCGMTVSGDDTSVKYTLSDYEYIRFDSESEYVIINGEYIELVNKILIDEDGCFVPYHFISKVITGLDFSYSAS